MLNPTFPENISEIPNITFHTIKNNCNKGIATTEKNLSPLSPEGNSIQPSGIHNSFSKGYTTPLNTKVQNHGVPSNSISGLLKELGVDYID